MKNAPQSPSNNRFDATVEFWNAGEKYGSESYSIEAADVAEAKRIALERSKSSIYDDDRIPDRKRRTRVKKSSG